MQGGKAVEDQHAETVDVMNDLYKAKLKEICERKGLDSRNKINILSR